MQITDRQEAAKILEQRGGYSKLEYTAALNMAISALRAQQTPTKLDRNRWEGCEFCKTELPEQGGHVSACNSFNISNNQYTPKFCPVCGRPLTEQAWAELERKIGGNDGTADNKT